MTPFSWLYFYIKNMFLCVSAHPQKNVQPIWHLTELSDGQPAPERDHVGIREAAWRPSGSKRVRLQGQTKARLQLPRGAKRGSGVFLGKHISRLWQMASSGLSCTGYSTWPMNSIMHLFSWILHPLPYNKINNVLCDQYCLKEPSGSICWHRHWFTSLVFEF